MKQPTAGDGAQAKPQRYIRTSRTGYTFQQNPRESRSKERRRQKRKAQVHEQADKNPKDARKRGFRKQAKIDGEKKRDSSCEIRKDFQEWDEETQEVINDMKRKKLWVTIGRIKTARCD